MFFFVGVCRAGLRGCLDTAGRAFVWVNDVCGERGSICFFFWVSLLGRIFLGALVNGLPDRLFFLRISKLVWVFWL